MMVALSFHDSPTPGESDIVLPLFWLCNASNHAIYYYYYYHYYYYYYHHHYHYCYYYLQQAEVNITVQSYCLKN